MSRRSICLSFIVVASLVCLWASAARAAGNHGEPAPDFPPGAFNDGQRYQLSDCQGKVAVLFFYEKDCPSCRGKIPERNAIVNQYKGKPVKFFAIAAGDTLQQAKAYAGGTKLAMPVYADSFSLMERRYGQTISLQNIYQFRVVGPDGKISGYTMEPGDIDKALEKVKPRFNPEDYHPKVRAAVDLFEWNQYPAGMKATKALLKSTDTEVVASAEKLLAAITEEGKTWLTDAEAASDSEPVKAYDLYAKASGAFGAADELGKKAAEAMTKLGTSDAVKKELEARKMYDRMVNVMAAANPSQRTQLSKAASDIVKKYPDTPTGKKVEEFQKEIGG
jgi:peroxiredoxin